MKPIVIEGTTGPDTTAEDIAESLGIMAAKYLHPAFPEERRIRVKIEVEEVENSGYMPVEVVDAALKKSHTAFVPKEAKTLGAVNSRPSFLDCGGAG